MDREFSPGAVVKEEGDDEGSGHPEMGLDGGACKDCSEGRLAGGGAAEGEAGMPDMP
ncbi:MAG: hypothetical protein MR015_05535 [Clostridiales bacterium]|nr:hypothetical protein [Clostridiales bacterium]